jgi:hypothetical protein
LLINGRLVQGAGTLDVINPATGRTLAAAPRADRAQLDQAVDAAKAAFPAWSATPLRQRAALLETMRSKSRRVPRVVFNPCAWPGPQEHGLKTTRGTHQPVVFGQVRRIPGRTLGQSQ